MDAYKTAKEAFHADNPGSSIWNVNAVSLAALVSRSTGLWRLFPLSLGDGGPIR